MNKKIISFFGIALFLILVIWEADKSSTVHLTWRSIETEMPFAGLLLLVITFTAVVCLLNYVVHRVVHKQFEDALSIVDNNIDESLSIKELNRNDEKIVLNRQDMDNAMLLLLKAMTSITAGDMRAARQELENLRKIIGNDTLIEVLTLKIYKGEKNYDKMEELSAKLMDNPNLQLISLKASIEAQMQKKEFEQALASANKAFEVRQDLYWVIESAFNLRAKAGDWEGALQVLNSGYKKDLIPQEKYRELKALTLYMLAEQAKENNDSVNFFKYCTQAVDTCKTLVPAALALAQYYADNDNQTRKAAKILSRIWRCNPTAGIARAYLGLWSSDTAVQKVQRMESLALTNSIRPSLNNLILAQLDIDAGLWGKAKSEFEIFLINNPATKSLAKSIVEYELKANQNKHAAENWKMKTAECAEDDMWVCETCGHSLHDWQAVCKKCGAVGHYKWRLYVENNPQKA